jgi:hypothetical protein
MSIFLIRRRLSANVLNHLGELPRRADVRGDRSHPDGLPIRPVSITSPSPDEALQLAPDVSAVEDVQIGSMQLGITLCNTGRPHMALGPGVPDPPPACRNYRHPNSRHRRAETYAVRAESILSGLHHEYFLEPVGARFNICGTQPLAAIDARQCAGFRERNSAAKTLSAFVRIHSAGRVAVG